MAPFRTYRGKAKNAAASRPQPRDLDNSLFDLLLGPDSYDKGKIFDSSPERDKQNSASKQTQSEKCTNSTTFSPEPVFFKKGFHDIIHDLPSCNSSNDSGEAEKEERKSKFKTRKKGPVKNKHLSPSLPIIEARGRRNRYAKKKTKNVIRKRVAKECSKRLSDLRGASPKLKVSERIENNNLSPIQCQTQSPPLGSSKSSSGNYACSTPLRSKVAPTSPNHIHFPNELRIVLTRCKIPESLLNSSPRSSKRSQTESTGESSVGQSEDEPILTFDNAGSAHSERLAGCGDISSPRGSFHGCEDLKSPQSSDEEVSLSPEEVSPVRNRAGKTSVSCLRQRVLRKSALLSLKEKRNSSAEDSLEGSLDSVKLCGEFERSFSRTSFGECPKDCVRDAIKTRESVMRVESDPGTGGLKESDDSRPTIFKYDAVEQFPSLVNISSRSSAEKHSPGEDSFARFTTDGNFQETVSDMFADSSDPLSDVSSENISEQSAGLQSSQTSSHPGSLKNHSSEFSDDDIAGRKLTRNIRDQSTIEISSCDDDDLDEDNSRRAVGISESVSQNSCRYKIESVHRDNESTTAKSTIKKPNCPVVDDLHENSCRIAEIQNGVCRKKNFGGSSAPGTQNVAVAPLSLADLPDEPLRSEVSSDSESDSFEMTSYSSDTNRIKSKYSRNLESVEETPSSDDGVKTRARVSLRLKTRKTWRGACTPDTSAEESPLPTVLQNADAVRTSERSAAPVSSSFTPDSAIESEPGDLATSGALADKEISDGEPSAASGYPEGPSRGAANSTGEEKRTTNGSGGVQTGQEREGGGPVDHLEERVVLPGGKKYRRSMSIVRHLAEEDSILTSVDQALPEQWRYSSKFQSTVGIQSADDRSLIDDVQCRRENELENVSRRLSILNLNCKNQVGNTAGLLPKAVNNRHFDFPDKDSEYIDYKELLLRLCKQDEPVNFDCLAGDGSFEKCRKIGEGVFGEVFILGRNGGNNVVLKIIPIEGDFKVNGEPQKHYSEVCSELIISYSLDSLKNEGGEWMSTGFMEMKCSWLIEGRYPDRLIELWDEYNDMKGSENDSPEIFKDDQLYLVLELGNAGTDLETYTFSTASQALSVFKQVVSSLAVAESAFEFEHRDLHWGNVLVSKTTEHNIGFTLNGKTYRIKTFGVKGTIIDYTLSSMKVSNRRIYNDISKDPDMFTATGDYQFDIYRLMREDLGNDWELFVPKTNVRWLHYLVDKMINNVGYARNTAKVHKDCMKQLKDIESWILDCDSSVQVALNIVS